MSYSGARTVFVITHEFHPKRGGIATFTEEIARAAVALGHPVEVWAQQAGPADEKSWPFILRRLPLRGSHDLVCRLKLIGWLVRERRRLRHAIVYLPEPGPMLALMMILPLRSWMPRHLVLTFHGSEILRFHADPLTRWLTGRLINRASRISVLTHYTQQLLGQHFPNSVPKTFLSPGALRTDFAIAPRSPAAGADSKVIVLTVGRLHPRKGQLLALQALQALPPALLARTEYWIAGSTSSPRYERTVRAAAAAQPGLVVKFLGNLSEEDLDRAYAQADIFALTSIDHGHSVEGFGLVYLEASAHGLPVIAHRVGGVAEAVDDGQTGLLVAPQHPAALTAAFRTLIEDADLRQRMGATGRGWARRHTWTRAAELLFNLDDESTANGSP